MSSMPGNKEYHAINNDLRNWVEKTIPNIPSIPPCPKTNPKRRNIRIDKTFKVVGTKT